MGDRHIAVGFGLGKIKEFGMTEDVKENLIKRGHKIGQLKSLGRVEGILIDKENNIIFGATDPRGFGSAEGY